MNMAWNSPQRGFCCASLARLAHGQPRGLLLQRTRLAALGYGRSIGYTRSVELHTLGRKYFVGVPLVLGMRVSPHRYAVQLSGKVWRSEQSLRRGAVLPFDNGRIGVANAVTPPQKAVDVK
jgi:hypothetical protein